MRSRKETVYTNGANKVLNSFQDEIKQKLERRILHRKGTWEDTVEITGADIREVTKKTHVVFGDDGVIDFRDLILKVTMGGSVCGVLYGLFYNSVQKIIGILQQNPRQLILLGMGGIIFGVAYTYWWYLKKRDVYFQDKSVLSDSIPSPSASFILIQKEDDPFRILFSHTSYSMFPLRCWCNLHAKVYSRDVSIGGFYGGEHYWDLQPFGIAGGHFSVDQILQEAYKTTESMQKDFRENDRKYQFRLEVEYWYHRIDKPEEIHKNPVQSHYFDFEHNALILDV